MPSESIWSKSVGHSTKLPPPRDIVMQLARRHKMCYVLVWFSHFLLCYISLIKSDIVQIVHLQAQAKLPTKSVPARDTICAVASSYVTRNKQSGLNKRLSMLLTNSKIRHWLLLFCTYISNAVICSLCSFCFSEV